jgi:hypothetical protein
MRVRSAALVCIVVFAGFAAAASADAITGKVVGMAPDVFPYQGVVFKMDHNGISSPFVGSSSVESPWMYYHFASSNDSGGMITSGQRKP